MDKEIKDIQSLIDTLKNQGAVSVDEIKQRKVVTISKLPGSGGKEIAEIVARRLGLKVFDHTIVTKLAEYTGMDKEAFSIIADVTGDTKDFWLYRIFGGGELSHDTIKRHLTNVIQALARSEDCVLMGRGSHVALKDLADIRVRVIAPEDVCISRIMEKEGCSKEEATETYNKVAASSGKFVWSVFDSRLNDPTNFDLVINTEKMSDYELCADVIIAAMEKTKNH